ncbi:hypothetical protein BDQ17DRAFT_1359916 [Cyathus striatus]|nr:hypothetical protein BDQ17DRAFT_1359916 [Cyathus striatus]
MVDYVYALHDFQPENEDEIPFLAGDRIEVVERDDLYGDGWWQGRNLAGKVGLFPHDGDGVMRATMTDVQKAIEQLGRREGDARSFSFASTRDGGETSETDFDLSDVGDADREDEGGGAWHKNTRRKLAERARKAVEDAEKLEAMMGGRQTFPPIDVEVSDESDDEEGHGDWTKSSGFRRLEPQILEEDEDGVSGSASEAEGKKAINGSLHGKEASGATATTVVPRDLSALANSSGATSSSEEREFLIPKEDEDDLATATRPTFPAIQSPPLPFPEGSRFSSPSTTSVPTEIGSVFRAQSPAKEEIKPGLASRTQSPVRSESPAARAVSPVRAQSPQARAQSPAVRAQSPAAKTQSPARAQSPLRPKSPPLRTESPPATGRRSPARHSLPTPVSPVAELRNVDKTPVSSAHQVEVQNQQAKPVTFNAYNSATSTLVNGDHEKENGKEKKHPSEWNVDEVIDWLKSKGFDQDVCGKFIEQEITGDVLLELDANILKSEIGILAFGKRVRIANAISDLRRPPSVGYSDTVGGEASPGYANFPPLSPNSQSGFSQGSQPQPGRARRLPYSGPTPTQAYAASGYGSQPHSRTQSQSQSHHSSFVAGHSYTQSLQSSLGSPIGNGGSYIPGADIPQVAESPVPTEQVPLIAAGEKDEGKLKPRPAHLSLSPSDGALKAKARAVGDIQAREEEDRGHMSESEALPSASVRRRLFGRSHDSSQSVPSRRASGEGSFVIPSPTTKEIPDKEKEKEKDEKDAPSVRSRHSRGRKSIDGGKGSTRLSFFGDPFAGTLGKGRKPAPRFNEDGTVTEKHSSMFSLPKLSHATSIRKVSGMSRTSVGSDERDGKDAKEAKEAKKEAKKEEERAKKDAERARKEEREKELKEDRAREKEKEKAKDPALLRKRVSSAPQPPSNGGSLTVIPGVKTGIITSGKSILEQIGEPDHAGWMRKKGERYNSWKPRYFVLKGSHLYWLRGSSKTETKIKGYIHIVGYKVTVDENLDPGRYGFRIDHDNDKSHFFSSDEKATVREWMKAIMKATIGRDYTKPVVSSCNIPTIPLVVAQTMNPAPRPPSPTARAATQKALRRENPSQLSSRDAQVLMALSNGNGERNGLGSPMFNQKDAETGFPATTPTAPKSAAPPRPSREMRRMSVRATVSTVEEALIEWANSRLPEDLQITDPTGPLCGGLALLRLAEAVKGKPASPPVPDSAFPTNPNDEKLDGLFRLFDFLLDNEVKIGSVSINDIRQGKREKIVQLLRALKAWEEKRRAITQNIGDSAVQAGSFMAPISHGRI